jgi:hypothetical protein
MKLQNGHPEEPVGCAQGRLRRKGSAHRLTTGYWLLTPVF